VRFPSYSRGFDVVGLDASDFMPWVATVGKVAGGLTGGFASGLTGGALDLAKNKGGGTTTEQQIAKALEAEKQRQAQAKAEADARTTKILLYSVVGLVGIGTTAFVAKAVFGKK
jgi:hypothetical protein